jgi:MFS family permease
VGGTLTIFLLPFFGRLADRFGHARVFTFASLGALASIYAITNLDTASIALALTVTSSFFVVASGRNVPATTMVTSVVRPESRGSFMSVRTSINQMAMGLSSFVAGLIVQENADGALVDYQYVGYIAIAMSLIAVALAWRLKAVE